MYGAIRASSSQVTGLWNWGLLKILNDMKLILDDQENHLTHISSVWNHSGPSEVPYVANQ